MNSNCAESYGNIPCSNCINDLNTCTKQAKFHLCTHNEMERGWREMSPTCPRCGSSNTKFCYYNNYSLTQPRYFCKGCRRYWTKGGSLRNVPVGGGCRKSRRSRSSTLRLTTSSNHHHGITSRNMALHGNHHHHQHHHYHHDHEHDHGNIINNNMGDSSASSEAPTIDLAIVYSNFLNQKPQNNNPPQVDLSSIPDATTIAPTFVDSSNNNNNKHTNDNDDNNPLSFSQTLPTIMPELLMNINHDREHDHHPHHHHHHHNQVLFVTEFSRPHSIHHHNHHEEVSSIQHDELIGLPPLPGGDSFMSQDHHHHHQPLPWAVSDLDHDHHQLQQHHDNDDVNNTNSNSNLQVPLKGIQDLESDSQFSNMFHGGNWSPLDLPGFETSSFQSKP